MYGLAGERRLDRDASSPGSRATRARGPVRAGNAAHGQFQLDVYRGNARSHARLGSAFRWPRCEGNGLGPGTERRCWIDFLGAGLRRSPTTASGKSAARSAHFAHSEGVAWAAIDRAIRSAPRSSGLEEGPGGPLAGRLRNGNSRAGLPRFVPTPRRIPSCNPGGSDGPRREPADDPAGRVPPRRRPSRAWARSTAIPSRDPGARPTAWWPCHLLGAGRRRPRAPGEGGLPGLLHSQIGR